MSWKLSGVVFIFRYSYSDSLRLPAVNISFSQVVQLAYLISVSVAVNHQQDSTKPELWRDAAGPPTFMRNCAAALILKVALLKTCGWSSDVKICGLYFFSFYTQARFSWKKAKHPTFRLHEKRDSDVSFLWILGKWAPFPGESNRVVLSR